jgi:acyl carrier protein
MKDSIRNKEIFEIVRKILKDNLYIEDDKKIKPNSNLVNDLGADSLDTVQIVMEVEDKFKISISDEDASKIETVQNLVDFVEERED